MELRSPQGTAAPNPWLVSSQMQMLDNYPPKRTVEWGTATDGDTTSEEDLAKRVKAMFQIFTVRLQEVVAKRGCRAADTVKEPSSPVKVADTVCVKGVDLTKIVLREVDRATVVKEAEEAAPLQVATEVAASVPPSPIPSLSTECSTEYNTTGGTPLTPFTPLLVVSSVTKATPAYEVATDTTLGHPTPPLIPTKPKSMSQHKPKPGPRPRPSHPRDLVQLQLHLEHAKQEVASLEKIHEELLNNTLATHSSGSVTSSVTKKNHSFSIPGRKGKSVSRAGDAPAVRKSLSRVASSKIPKKREIASKQDAELKVTVPEDQGQGQEQTPKDEKEREDNASPTEVQPTEEELGQRKQHLKELHSFQRQASEQDSERKRQLMSLNLLPLLIKREVQVLENEHYMSREYLRKKGEMAGRTDEQAIEEGLKQEVLTQVTARMRSTGETGDVEVVENELKKREEVLRSLQDAIEQQVDRNELLSEEMHKEKAELESMEELKKEVIINEYNMQRQRDGKLKKFHKEVQCCIKATNVEEEIRVLVIKRKEELMRQELANLRMVLANVATFHEVTESELVCRFCLCVTSDAYTLYPCGHSVCRACIVDIRADDYTLQCPDCKQLSCEAPVRNCSLSGIASRFLTNDASRVLATMHTAIDSVSSVLKKWDREPPKEGAPRL